MDKGAVWGSSDGLTKDLLSWHEIELQRFGFARLWFHSRLSRAHTPEIHDRVLRSEPNEEAWYPTFIGMEIQIHGSKLKPVTEQEKLLKLELASHAPMGSNFALNSSVLREIPVSQLETDHRKIISLILDSGELEDDAKLRLVKRERAQGKIFKDGAIGKFGGALLADIRTTNQDALAIAKLYSDLYRLGSRKIIQEIAERTGASTNTIYVAIRVARSKEWLTSSGVGKSGGELTPLGEKEFKTRGAQARLDEFLQAHKGKK